MHKLPSDANRNHSRNVARRARGRFHPRNEVSREIMSSPSLVFGLNNLSVSDEPRVMHIEFTEAAPGRNRSRNVAKRGRPSPLPRNARVPLFTPLEMLEHGILFQEEPFKTVDDEPQNIFNRNDSKNVNRRARTSFNQRSIFTEHGNVRMAPLTSFETFEHEILFHDNCATNKATEDTDDMDEEILEIEDSMDTNVSDTWSINNRASEHEGEDDFTDENEEASREIMSSPSLVFGLNNLSVSDEPGVMHIEFTEAALDRNRSRNVAKRGRPSPLPRNALVYHTPFKRGETFNEFAKNLELEEIVGLLYEVDEMILLCDVKLRNDGNRIRRIESSLLRRYCPGMLVDFYEKLILQSISK